MKRAKLDIHHALLRAAACALALMHATARHAAAQESRERTPARDARQGAIALHPKAELPVGADRVVPAFRLAPVDAAELAAAARRREAELTRDASGEAP